MKNAASKSTYLLWGCLAALVFLPLLTVGLLYLGILSERERFSAFSSVATQLQAIQDAEVDFSLARRASQAYLRIGDPVDREAMRSLIERSRQKVAASRSPDGNEPTDAMLARSTAILPNTRRAGSAAASTQSQPPSPLPAPRSPTRGCAPLIARTILLPPSPAPWLWRQRSKSPNRKLPRWCGGSRGVWRRLLRAGAS